MAGVSQRPIQPNETFIERLETQKTCLILKKEEEGEVMEPSKIGNWKLTLLYFTFIFLILHFLHNQKLLLLSGNDTVRVKRKADLPLRFRSDGTFKILQVADMHFANGIMSRCRDVLDSEFNHCSNLNTTRFLNTLLRAEKPDFIAFTGISLFLYIYIYIYIYTHTCCNFIVISILLIASLNTYSFHFYTKFSY